MYQHHKDSLEKMIQYFTEIDPKKDEIIAIVFGGSVAKGCERPDSDLDAMIILTDSMYETLREQRRTAECIHGYCTYPEGYFDIKYYNKEFLWEVAQKGSEPARNAFLKARCVYTKDPEIPGLVEQISRFPVEEQEDKMLSLYAAFRINTGYFWNMSHEDVFLRTKAVTEIVLYGLRMLLEENQVLFPCPKSLYKAVRSLEHKPEGILEKADALLIRKDDESKADFVNTLMDFLDYEPPADQYLALSRYVEDNELWWKNPRPLVAEW
ncbi:MAG: nucleotidyltransferase domain-containing protein [Massiliimalia sp.]|jgi:predicted nucleotidyltransferase